MWHQKAHSFTVTLQSCLTSKHEQMFSGNFVRAKIFVHYYFRSVRFRLLRFMNIAVDETNIIPYEVYRRYISGSARASLTISGDVIGPIFPDGEAAMLR